MSERLRPIIDPRDGGVGGADEVVEYMEKHEILHLFEVRAFSCPCVLILSFPQLLVNQLILHQPSQPRKFLIQILQDGIPVRLFFFFFFFLLLLLLLFYLFPYHVVAFLLFASFSLFFSSCYYQPDDAASVWGKSYPNCVGNEKTQSDDLHPTDSSERPSLNGPAKPLSSPHSVMHTQQTASSSSSSAFPASSSSYAPSRPSPSVSRNEAWLSVSPFLDVSSLLFVLPRVSHSMRALTTEYRSTTTGTMTSSPPPALPSSVSPSHPSISASSVSLSLSRDHDSFLMSTASSSLLSPSRLARLCSCFPSARSLSLRGFRMTGQCLLALAQQQQPQKQQAGGEIVSSSSSSSSGSGLQCVRIEEATCTDCNGIHERKEGEEG